MSFFIEPKRCMDICPNDNFPDWAGINIKSRGGNETVKRRRIKRRVLLVSF